MWSTIGMQVKASDTNAYYSCDDKFSLVDKAVRSDHGEGHSEDQLLNIDEMDDTHSERMPNLGGTC